MTVTGPARAGPYGTSDRLLLHSCPVPMWIFDVETLCFLEVNEAAIASYGWSRAEFLAMTILDIRPAEDVEKLRRDIGQPTPATMPRSAGLWRHCRRGGDEITVEISTAEVIYDGRIARLVLAIDVTERQRLEQARADSEARFRAVFSHAPVAQAILSLSGTVQHVNPMCCSTPGRHDDD